MTDCGDLELESISNCGDEDLDSSNLPGNFSAATVRPAGASAAATDERTHNASTTEDAWRQEVTTGSASGPAESRTVSTTTQRRDNVATQSASEGHCNLDTAPSEAPQGSDHSQPSATRERSEGERRDSIATNSRPQNGTIPGTITEEPPPLYSSLFPETRRLSIQAPQQPLIHQHHQETSWHRPHISQSTLHPQALPPHHCSFSHAPHGSVLYCHASHPLPGATGQQHYPDPHIPRHSTILLSDYHHSGSQGQPRNIPDDYIMLSFACVLLCTLHLNLPALLCVLPALAHSIKTQRLNSEGRYVQAQWYSRRAITCNLLAFGQYIVLVMATAISMFILFYI